MTPTSAADAAAAGGSRRASWSFSAASGGTGSEAIWEEDGENRDGRQRKGKSRKDEPMSPVAVILYVAFFYLAWQILTRSDEREILSHLPSSSPLHLPQTHEHTSVATHQPPYHLPYPLPQIPSPMHTTTTAAGGATSTWRVVLAAIVYPIYVAVTLLAIPFPLLINALNLVLSVLSTVLYPITSTARLFARTFLIGPLIAIRNFLAALYPVYVFVGGVVAVSAFLGVTVAWIGQRSLDYLLGRKRPVVLKRRKSSRKSKSTSRRSPSLTPSMAPPQFQPSVQRSVSLTVPPHRRPQRERSTSFVEPRYAPIADENDDEVLLMPRGEANGTAREPVVVGIRRRGGHVFS